jgi:hypothetical protein
MSAKVSVKSAPVAKVIKPLNPVEFDSSKLIFGNVITNTEIGNKYCKITYGNANVNINDNKFLVVARGCIVKTFKKLDNKDKDGKIIKGKKDKYQIFMGLKDEKFITMINDLDKYLITQGIEYSEKWFDEKMELEECTDMLKATLSNHEKYGYAIGSILGNDFVCKSNTPDVPDVSNLELALEKNTVVDVCFNINKVKLGVGKYNLGFEINQLNIKSIGGSNGEQYESNALKPEDYTSGNLTLSPIQQHDKGGKFCELLYQDKKLRIRLANITGRIFKYEKDDTVSYSMSIRLTDENLRNMIEGIDKEILTMLMANSKDYYGSKKTEKLLKAILKPLLSYNKTDQEKIKKGEKPQYDPSIWIKIWHSSDKGFDGKIINSTSTKPITNTEDIINKDLNISNIEIYSRHIWFGPKGTSINLTLNKCAISYDAPVYDMDDIEDGLDAEKDEVTDVEETEEGVESDAVEDSDED